ncbi:MAG TPA: hypothetical protein VK187_02340, partial [Geobacteraceae bacterium]|nr:hypothetical protein [Geobacteraceae bacterium]
VRHVRKTRDFAVAVSFTETDMEKLLAMLPPELRGSSTATGTLTTSGFRFSGNAAHGITSGKGQISLLRGGLTRSGKSIAKNLAAAVSLERARGGWEVHGEVTEGAGAGDNMVQGLEARFNALLSSGMKLLQAEIPSFAATLSGIALKGKLGYRSGSPEPIALSLRVDKAPVTAVNRYLAGGRAAFSAGTMALDLQATGRGGRDFRGKLKGGLTGIRGSADGKDFTVREGVITADFNSIGGKLSAGGDFRGGGALPGGKPIQVASVFGIRDRELSLSDGTVVYDRARLRFARIRGALPVVIKEGELTRLPLHLHFDGISGERDEVAIGGLAGDLAGDFVTGRGKRWLAGNGNLTVTSLVFKGREAGSLAGRLKFTESGATARIEGKLLGGRLEGTAGIDPFGAKKKAGFSLNLDGAQCADLSSFLPARQPVKCGGGLAGVKLTGEYAADQGLQCRVEANGTGIVLTGKEGRRLLADGSLHALCDVTRDSLVIREGSAGAGNGVTLRVRGEVARFLAADRAGEISLQLSETPVASLVAASGAALPQGFREVTASGTFGAQGTLRISRTTIMLDGEASLAKAGIEIPAQHVSASDISGAVPFSLVIAGAAGPVKKQQQNYSRENYPALLDSLRQAARSGHTFRIGKLRFSGLEFADTALGIRAGSGLIEMTVLESKFLEGSLLGRGFFRYGKNMQYGGDLLLNELSLRALCNSFPKIKGYISGRMDGMIDLHGEGKGLNGLIGIVNIWTRSVPKEKMLVSKEFLQKLAGEKLKGIFFQNDRPYDTGEISGYLEKGYLVFNMLDISHTNFLGIRDLSVSVAPVQNKIALEHLFASIKEAATRGKAAGKGEEAAPGASPPVETEFKWEE